MFDILIFENLLRICLDNDSILDIFNLSFNSMICFVNYLENYKINLEIILHALCFIKKFS